MNQVCENMGIIRLIEKIKAAPSRLGAALVGAINY